MNLTHQKIKRQGPEAHAAMKRATKLSDAQIARFTKDPDDCGLSEEQLDLLDGWARNEFGYMSTGDGYVRVKHTPQPALVLPRYQNPKHVGRHYEAGQGGAGFTTSPAKNKGADLPSPTDAKQAAAKRKEAQAEQEKRSRFANPFKKGETKPLYPAGSIYHP